jgi:glutathione peroxidase
MKLASLLAVACLAGPVSGTGVGVMSLYELTADTLDGSPKSLADYKGQVVLVVNTASECGYTPQYAGLEKLYQDYKGKGFVVLGFPSNDFGGQEPGDAKQIGETCFNFYGVRFPMFSKITVKGASTHPLYAQLAQATGQAPGWNFHKYLVDRQGRVVASFKSDVEPEDKRLTAEIDRLLAAR